MKKNNLLLIILSFIFIGETKAQHARGSFYTGDALVTYIKSGNRIEKAAIVMIPGANLSTYIYATTPDGRKGWAEMFADDGYDVYMVNDPRYDFATGGFVSPYTIPANGKAATPGSEQGWQNDIWRRWGFGSEQGMPYADALFPTAYFDTFAHYYPYLGSSNQSYADAVSATIDSTQGKVWILAHSAGASRAVSAAKEMAPLVNGLILIEPAGPPDADDFPDLAGMHMFGVYGDYITSRNQTNRKIATETAATLFASNGGIADVVSLPEDSMVNGNSHILMQDSNSAYIQDIVSNWLQNFTTASVSHVNGNKEKLLIYPNPTSGNSILNIKASNAISSLEIYNLEGKLVQDYNSQIEKLNKWNVSKLTKGIYIVNVLVGDVWLSQKLVIH